METILNRNITKINVIDSTIQCSTHLIYHFTPLWLQIDSPNELIPYRFDVKNTIPSQIYIGRPRKDVVFILDWIRDNKSVESNKPNAGELQLLILVGLTKIVPDVILFNIGGTLVQIRKEIANQFQYLTGLIEIQSNEISFIDRDGQNFLEILKHVEQGIFDQLPKYLLENADFFGCRVKSDSNYCIICMCEMKCGAICHQICQECNKSHQQCILCGQGRNSNKRLSKNNNDFIERQVKSSMAYNIMNSAPQITKFRTVKKRATHSNMYDPIRLIMIIAGK